MQRRVEEAIPLRRGDDIPAVPPLIPRVPVVQEKAPVPPPPPLTLLQRVRRLPQTIGENIDRKTAGYAAAVAMAFLFIKMGYEFYHSDWLNIGQAEHRQLKEELARPYLQRNKELSNFNWTSSGADCYLILEGQYNFTSCYWSCYQARGLPASIHSQEENQFIWNLLMKKKGIQEKRAWLGLAEIDGTWTNQDNSQFNYYNWRKSVSKSNGKNFCAQMIGYGDWTRGECQDELNFCICKDYGVACPLK